jgi:hypothetical protein
MSGSFTLFVVNVEVYSELVDLHWSSCVGMFFKYSVSN